MSHSEKKKKKAKLQKVNRGFLWMGGLQLNFNVFFIFFFILFVIFIMCINYYYNFKVKNYFQNLFLLLNKRMKIITEFIV